MMTILYKSPNKRKSIPHIVPPIPLEKLDKKPLVKGKYHTYKLRANPTDLDLPTYELSVPFFSNGTCEDYMKFCTNFDKVCKGQNITNGPGRFTLARRLLEGKALTSFKNEANTITSETNESVKQCLDAVHTGTFPQRAVVLQKCYMRKALQKPRNMKTREWLVHVYELNNYLPCFPGSGPPTG